MTASSESHWFKSSYSGGSGTECVECAYTDGSTLIRDSKRVDGPLVRVRSGAWRTFVEILARGSLK
ncbi:DUF397 domain-containing protein [Streptomyces sp. NPDC005526]|uniref:DUF397 domain-containing protein n=1 Tax=Streptomyces sp. NPDC005526 TaxID=3156885 RepID=UPI0033A2BC85